MTGLEGSTCRLSCSWMRLPRRHQSQDTAAMVEARQGSAEGNGESNKCASPHHSLYVGATFACARQIYSMVIRPGSALHKQ